MNYKAAIEAILFTMGESVELGRIAYLTTLGETLLPQLPVSLTSSVILPYSLNAVTPNIVRGFRYR